MRDEIVVILEDLKFDWTVSQLKKITYLWNEGLSIKGIKKEFKYVNNLGVSELDIALAIMHLNRESKIKSRKGGLLGTKDKLEVVKQ